MNNDTYKTIISITNKSNDNISLLLECFDNSPLSLQDELDRYFNDSSLEIYSLEDYLQLLQQKGIIKYYELIDVCKWENENVDLTEFLSD